MHTPRFSGQPASAGDFVFIRTASRPILTSCENVGTVVPLSRARIFASPARRAHKIARVQSSAERSTANPEIPPARNSVRTPRGRTILLGLQFGEAYSALRGWRPIPAALLSHSVLH